MTITCDNKIFGCILEDSAFSLLARVIVDGEPWTQDQVDTITYKVWDTADPVTPVDSGSVTVADSVFDTLQTDLRWTIDDDGYNFLHTLDAGVIAAPGTYRIEYKVTLLSGTVFLLTPFEVTAQDMWTE